MTWTGLRTEEKSSVAVGTSGQSAGQSRAAGGEAGSLWTPRCSSDLYRISSLLFTFRSYRRVFNPSCRVLTLDFSLVTAAEIRYFKIFVEKIKANL